jgi:MFS-type transporter involved in bile tolerance (Atg22 family)
MGGIGTIIASLVGSTLYEININFPFWMGSGLVIVASLLVFIFMKEPKEYQASEKQPNMFQSLGELFRDKDKSGLRILFAIFFWFLAYTGVEAFLTLYATKSLGIPEGDAGRLTGHMGIFFVLFAMVAGVVGSRIGRRITISIGIIGMAALLLTIGLMPADLLSVSLTKLPALGTIRVLNLFLMGAGIAWSFININSLPMVVDLTTAARIGTFTGLYYLFSTFSAIVGPNLNGLIVQLNNNNYTTMLYVGPLFLLVALVLMLGVKRGEAKKAE